MVTDEKLNADNLLPNAFDTNVAKAVAKPLWIVQEKQVLQEYNLK
jgi:hypothetical protein